MVQARDGARDRVTCGSGQDAVKLDADDVIADATADDANGSCEDVRRAGAQEESESSPGRRPGSPDGRDCPAKEEQPSSGETQS